MAAITLNRKMLNLKMRNPEDLNKLKSIVFDYAKALDHEHSDKE